MVILAVCLGIAFAIVLNGLADNLPSEYVPYLKIREWLFPRCAYCGTIRKPQDWSAGWALIRRGGGCARCGAPRPARDFLVEAALPILLIAMVVLLSASPLDLLAETAVISVFLLISVIDFEHRAVLSEVILWGGLIIGIAGIRHELTWMIPMLEGAIAGLAIAFFLYLFGYLIAHLFHLGGDAEPLGFGDVLIAGLVGLATGWPGVMMAMFVAVFLGGVVGILILMVHRWRGRDMALATMAYGPYLALAALILHFQGTWIAAQLLK